MATKDGDGRRHLPSLTALRAFEALGRRGSVRGAADELSISHTVVSRHIRHLQDALGVTLVRPQGRGVALTEEGQAYHDEVARAFSILNMATATIRAARRTRLDVWCSPGIVNRRLLPRLPELTRRLDQFEVTLQPTLAVPRLEMGEADAVLIYADEPETGDLLRAEDIVRPRVFPVASPAFLDRHPIGSLEALAKAPLLHEDSTRYWERWLSLAGLPGGPRLGGPCLWHSLMAIEAARLGQGIALVNELLVEEELRTGVLREVLPSTIHLGWYRTVALAKRWDDPAMQALRDWLRTTLLLPAAVP